MVPLLPLLLALLLLALGPADGFARGPSGSVRVAGHSRLRTHAQTDAKDASDKPPFLKHVCVSCQYEYDEEKGFKKRYPPGTRFADLKTFNCPVCGASKEQFKVMSSSQD